MHELTKFCQSYYLQLEVFVCIAYILPPSPLLLLSSHLIILFRSMATVFAYSHTTNRCALYYIRFFFLVRQFTCDVCLPVLWTVPKFFYKFFSAVLLTVRVRISFYFQVHSIFIMPAICVYSFINQNT